MIADRFASGVGRPWAAVAVLAVVLGPAGHATAAAKPNFVVIVADDMGFSDAGCYGGEIATPHLDRLADGGLRWTQFYNTSRCWPTRASLLTGYYPQQVRRDAVPGVVSGARGVRPAWAKLLPDRLRQLGYRSYHSGKWHVDGQPTRNGFDRSYRLDDHDRHFNPKTHFEDDQPLPVVGFDDDYYSSTAIADHAIRFLRQHEKEHRDRPFFAFVAFTAPHFPLHARAADISAYRDKYLAGWDALRDERWRRLRALGIGGKEMPPIERDLGPPYPFPKAIEMLGDGELTRPVEWDRLGSEQRAFQAAKMAVHAAMVECMDREIGRIVDQVRAMGALDETLILFLSDNGASAEIMVRGDGHDPTAACGTGATFLCIGPGWSSLANTPFRRHKTWVHEGGISTPLIAHWPAGISARGQLRHTPGHVIDLAPTILELAGAPAGSGRDPGAPALPGRSLAPVFTADNDLPRDPLWWAHEGNRALRAGRWKIVAAGRSAPWELYDMTDDRSETRNVASRNPDTVRELAARWDRMTQSFHADAGAGETPR
jgi:arylsulfatase